LGEGSVHGQSLDVTPVKGLFNGRSGPEKRWSSKRPVYAK
jgi:hypothetical protein